MQHILEFDLNYIRNRLIDVAIGVVILLLLPSLAASLSHSIEFGWSFLLYFHILVAIIMLSMYVFRNRLSINAKYHMFTMAAICMGLIGIFYKGLVGSYSFILLGVFIAIMGLNKKAVIIYISFALVCMLGIGILFKFSVLTLELNIQEYNTSLPAWATKIFLVALISFIIIYSASLYNGFFKKAFAEVRLSTKQLNAAKIEAEETIAFLPIPIMVINTELDIVYINDKYKESFGDCLSEGITFKQWLNNLHESESENKLTFNSIKDELLNITNLNSRTAVYSVGIKCVKDSVKFVELSAKKVNERFILSMVDVTERINYQNKLIVKERILQEQNEQLQSYTEELRQQNEEFLSMNEELSESYEHIQKMNVDLQEAKEKAEESDRLKSAFLSNMSHEIRTPMNGIIGFADLLIEADLEEDERKNYTSIISGSSKQLLNIVNDIIDFSKIEAGAIEIFNSKIDIYESLSDLQLFFAPMANEKGIELILGANLCSTDCRFVTDHTKLKQVLTNLLSNAIKFTKSGFVKFGVERVKDQMWFYVEDSGIGISTGKLGLVFERFRKVNEDSPGTGLGLAISKSYIEVLGGEIDVESEIGKGTRFSFNIPIKDIAEQKIY